MRKLEGTERDAMILEIIRRIEGDEQVIGAPERTAIWERGWHDALLKFKAHPVEASLVPAFIRSNQTLRIKGDLWVDTNEAELEYVRGRQNFIGQLLQHCDAIAEFGCGTGFNLVALAKRFPKKQFYGFDFASSAVDLTNTAGWSLQLPILAACFNMLHPNAEIPVGAGVFTFGSVEQLAGNFQPFIEYLIQQQPSMVVHTEPVVELYDPADQLDALAIAFHNKRGYTTGLLPWLEKDERVQIIDVRRANFGSLMQEGYSLIAWRPK